MKKVFPFKSTLEDEVIQLRIITDNDFHDLSDVAFAPSLWEFMVFEVSDPVSLRNWIQSSIYEFMNRVRVPFAIYHKIEKKVIGSTSFGNISEFDGRLEIGWTWIGEDYQGTGINKRAKKLMLEFAFEKLFAERVEFKTDVLNEKSRKAVSNLGATKEGILRSYSQMPNDRRRDTVFYSILAEEWEKVKERL